jgi:hypothetical protein
VSKALLARYIRLVIEARNARVPNQLLDASDTESGEKEKDEVEDVNEFSGVGAVAGYTAPLGMSPDDLGRKKGRTRRKK